MPKPGNILPAERIEDLVLVNVGPSERNLERFVRHIRTRFWSPRISRDHPAPRWVRDVLWWVWHCQLYPIRRESGRWNFTGYATGIVGSHYNATASGVTDILMRVSQALHIGVSRVRLPCDADELKCLTGAIETLRGTRNVNLVNHWVGGLGCGQLYMLNSSYETVEHVEDDAASCWVVVEPPAK